MLSKNKKGGVNMEATIINRAVANNKGAVFMELINLLVLVLSTWLVIFSIINLTSKKVSASYNEMDGSHG